MATMSRTNSASAFHGFSVSQPFLGAALQWLPAIGTQELDDLVNNFLPGPASIQDKRAHVAMDFFEYSCQTGETIKFYPVKSARGPLSTHSPATSSTYDSGYSTGASPTVSGLIPCETSPATLASPSVPEEVRTKAPSSSKKSSASSLRDRHTTTDFSNHPGMRIMTKDGLDVTSSATRGSKTKEQRDHAHLMRIIKACDACRRKKIRCDPSHRKRPASQVEASSQSETKAAKKPRKPAAPPPVQAQEANISDSNLSLDLALVDSSSSFDSVLDNITDELPWDQFFQFDAASLEFPGNFELPQNFDFSFPSQDPFYPGDRPMSPSQAFTSTTDPVEDLSPTANHGQETLATGEPLLPYLNPGRPHGTSYVDFDLFSPVPDFLDEEPRPLQKATRMPTLSVSPDLFSPVSGCSDEEPQPIQKKAALVQTSPASPMPTIPAESHAPSLVNSAELLYSRPFQTQPDGPRGTSFVDPAHLFHPVPGTLHEIREATPDEEPRTIRKTADRSQPSSAFPKQRVLASSHTANTQGVLDEETRPAQNEAGRSQPASISPIPTVLARSRAQDVLDGEPRPAQNQAARNQLPVSLMPTVTARNDPQNVRIEEPRSVQTSAASIHASRAFEKATIAAPSHAKVSTSTPQSPCHEQDHIPTNRGYSSDVLVRGRRIGSGPGGKLAPTLQPARSSASGSMGYLGMLVTMLRLVGPLLAALFESLSRPAPSSTHPLRFAIAA